MKKLTLSLLLLLAVLQLMAVPAKRGNTTVTQPDGSTVTIALHGDEWLHYETTADGYSIVRNDKGYYVYAEKKQGQLMPTTVVAHDSKVRNAQEVAFLAATQKYLKPEIGEQVRKQREQVIAQQKKAIAKRRQMKKAGQLNDTGTETNYKSLVILVQFNNKSFSRSDYKAVMTNMINQQNYTGYQDGGSFVECTGSVRDYFTDNSGGNFRPEFDVYGPYTVNYSVTYPQGTQNAATILNAAVNAADSDVDFSQYDNDGDGVVDNIYFILAGNGANYGGNNQNFWWPHRSVIYNPQTYQYIQKDGVYLYDYASSVELYGYTNYPSTVHIDGIGTFCHEFSHVLGLPDFYDTDYEENGQSNDPGTWDVMAGGSYENDGRTPVAYTYPERLLLEFAEEHQITEVGNYTLDAITSSNSGFVLQSGNESEVFTFENRQKVKWDEYLPGHGMLAFRVDFSDENVWQQNTVNANPAHNYYELLRADGVKKYQGEVIAAASDPFPGTSNKTTLNNITTPNLKTWAGLECPYGLKNIKEQDGVITFDVEGVLEVNSITLPEETDLKVGMTLQLEPTIEPSSAPYILTWTSSNPAVATVSNDGLLTGVSVGTTTVTVTTDNGLSASTTVTVGQLLVVESIAAFKALPEDSEAQLELTDVQVNYVNGTDAYVSDATGAIIMRDMPLTLKAGDILNGNIYVKNTVDGYMPVAEAVEDLTSANDVQITEGTAQAKKVKLSELTPADYAQYIEIERVEMVREIGDGTNYYMYKEGDDKLILDNKFKISMAKVPSPLEDYRFTQKGIYGTRQVEVDGVQYDDIYPTAKWTQTKVTKYGLSYDVSEGGKILIDAEEKTGTGQVTYIKGDDITLTAVPDEGYELESVLLNDEDVTSQFVDGATYTIESLAGNMNITVTFKEIVIPPTTYTLSYEIGEGGQVTINDEPVTATGSLTFDEGTMISIVAVADENYELESASLNNEDVVALLAESAPLVIEALDGDKLFSVTFKEKQIETAIGRILAAHVGEAVAVYSIDGRQIAETTIGAGGSIDLPAPLRGGVYVVKVGTATYKVVKR